MKTQVAARETPFDLSSLPAVRTETQRRFGLWLTLFSLPFTTAAIAGVLFTWNMGDAIFPILLSLFSLLPLALLLWGLNCLFTTITTTVTSTEIRQTEQSPIKNRDWLEPLSSYRLQLKILTSRQSDPSDNAMTIGADDDMDSPHSTGQLSDSFHIRLKHADDLRSVELFETESADKVWPEFQKYRDSLNVRIDEQVRDFNTDHPLRKLESFARQQPDSRGNQA